MQSTRDPAAVAFVMFALGISACPEWRGQCQTGIDSFRGDRAGDETTVYGIRVCWCPPGKFMMGSPLTEPERRSDEKQVAVTLTQGFWMGKFEVTQGEW